MSLKWRGRFRWECVHVRRGGGVCVYVGRIGGEGLDGNVGRGVDGIGVSVCVCVCVCDCS